MQKDRFILFTDFHIHNHGNDWRRVDDALEVLDWILEESKEREINDIFFLGDFFHVRGYMYPTIVSRAYEKLQEFKKAGKTVHMLVGNHDMPRKHTTRDNTLSAFDAIHPVIAEPHVFEGEKFNFFFLPYVEDPDRLNWAIDRLVEEQMLDMNQNVLLAHLDINKALYHNQIRSTHGVDAASLSKKFDMIITGHYHINQQIKDNIWYVGSPYQQNYSESGQRKGFYVFEDGDLEFVENTFSPKYLYIKEAEIDASIENCYVTIFVSNTDNQAEIREKALQFNPRNVRMKTIRKEVNTEKLIEIKNDAADIAALFQEWVERNANEEMYDMERLFKYGMDIVHSSETEVGE